MEANYYDMKELRNGIRNTLGIDKYLDALWEKEYSAGERQEILIRKERPRLEKEYVRVSHIFFNTFQNPEIESRPEKVRNEARSRAQSAFDRLRKGEPFGIVAKQVSEDTFSKSGGGSLGCIPFNYFGDKAAKAISKLETWEYSEPVESTLGFHIFLREPITRNNILALLKESFTSKKREDIETSMTKEAKVERGASR